MTRSPVYLGSSYAGLLYFNNNGHNNGDPFAIDNPNRLSEIIEQLSELSDPENGEKLFSGVFESKDLYSGSAVNLAPNLVLDIYDSPWNILASFRRGYVGESVHDRYYSENYNDYGHHSRQGIFVFSGQDFKTGISGNKGRVMDLPATLLHLYGTPVPEDYDGILLREVIDPEFIQHHPLRTQPGDEVDDQSRFDNYLWEDPQEMLEHLKALGYLD
jgi:predicted AlkP superfamily phosphohydrolase/phosphomutase